MRHYTAYMDRQTLSPEARGRLLSLAPAPRRRAGGHLARYGALAACCALAVGLGAWWASPWQGETADVPTPQVTVPADPSPSPALEGGFVADGGQEGDPSMFYAIPYVEYADLTGTPQTDNALTVPPAGAFWVELSEEEIRGVLWGGEIPADAAGNVPWYLLWDGYVLTGSALYDKDGALIHLSLTGDHPDGGHFAINLAPERLPALGCWEPEAAVTTVNGVEAETWLRRDGEGGAVTCGASFLTGGVGVRAVFTGGSDTLLCDLFLRAYCAAAPDPALSLAGLLTADDIPAWRYEELSSLTQARQEAAFAPYLPAAAPAGYGDFYGLLTYQEGVTNSLYLRWSRGYADVSVRVSLPEGENTVAGVLVDPDAPETYDKRLYSIPWADSVPEEHRQSVDNPVFPAEEMTRALVEARAHLKTEWGEPDALVIDFAVLHPDGTVAEYRCEGLTVDQVWEMVAETL